MGIFDKLFGKKEKNLGKIESATEKGSPEQLSHEALTHISAALQIIEAQVKIEKIEGRFCTIVHSAGSEGKVMEAVRRFDEAHKIHPDNALLHYAYASCLLLAKQGPEARDEMKKVSENHPDFTLARLALGGWDLWESPFNLPQWGQDSNFVHPMISQTLPVEGRGLYLVRDGYMPRATVFLRDAGDFQDLEMLRSARIDLATVISPVSNPQVVGIYGKIWDNPRNAFNFEVLYCPFRPRGDSIRCGWELLCIQEDIDFVIIDQKDCILLNKRLRMPKNMLQTNQRILAMFAVSEGQHISLSEFMNAIMRHQSQFSLSDVRY